MKHLTNNVRKLAAIILLFIFVSSKSYSDLPSITPEEAGFDSTKLAEVTNQADAVYEAGLIPNYVIALAKDGKVFFSASRGNRIIGEVDPVGMDTLFPLASMSKPVASSAIFKLIEEGKLSLDSELREFYPQFQSMFVAQDGDLDNQFREAERAITILDLLTHTSGLEYAASIAGTGDVAELYDELGLINACISASDNMDLLSQVPLVGQPGQRWNYSVSLDVIGAVIEVVSGEPLGSYANRTIFEPLGIIDSGWRHTDDRLDTHYATLYNPPLPGEAAIGQIGGTGINWQLSESPRYSACPVGSEARIFDMGGSGLVGTATDYLVFSLMIANLGILDGIRILEENSVIAQTTQQVDAAQNINGNAGRLFGAGFGISLDPDNPSEEDFYSWGGSNSTGFFIDPKDGTVGVQMSSCYRCRQALIPNIEEIVDQARIED